MTQFLLNRFVKQPLHTAAGRNALGQMAGITGIGCNLLLFLGKLLAGLAVGSIAIAADAFNNLSDAASSLMTLLGFRLAKRPADTDHPYGHARYEYLAALAVSVLILLLGVELAKSSVTRIFRPEPVETGLLSYLVLVGSMGLKFWMSRFYKTLGCKISSPVLMASSEDSRNDVLTTAAVLLCCILYQIFGLNLDGIAGLAVAVFILISGIRSVKDTVSPLLGQQADSELVEALRQLILSHEKVKGIHDLLIHDYGPGQCFASVHAEVSAKEDTLHIHDILEDIEEDALQKLQVHLVIHCDPVVENSPELEHLQALTRQAAAAIDPRLSVHDLHQANHEGVEKLVFDLEVPYDLDCPHEQLEQQMKAALQSGGVTTEILIHIDGK